MQDKDNRLAIIAALGANNAIGLNNTMPWDAPEDLKHFAKTTKHSVLIMGRKTFESIGKALPNRQTIVISNSSYAFKDCIVQPSLEAAIEWGRTINPKTIWIAGGANVYEQALPKVNRMILSHFDMSFKADTYFPEFNLAEWKVKDLQRCEVPPKFTVKEFIRK